ncbi:putative late blight resistance protein homolog R1A-10 [Capsicum annuum]|uniref:putative late blight resistance protein homolog R1A-10 n=1 Tax=Capsicum annuum TaxID=4072 RepID=UPI001FB05706|nr:putative late blight resistance protein homolog R1A-10 [Capsicum annuum]
MASPLQNAVQLLSRSLTVINKNIGIHNKLVHLKQLETLSLKLFFSDLTIPCANVFPATLNMLKLLATNLSWLYLDIIAELKVFENLHQLETWNESVAEDVKSFLTNDLDEQCSRVLGLSYNHLTGDLKTCLLHFGTFPEDSEISVKNLMRLWMAEGFLKLENDLEGEAEKCLQEFVDRCLVLIQNVDISRCIKCCPLNVDKIDYCRYGLYRALLTPVHPQLRDHDNNDLFNRTRSIFSSYPYIPPEICRLWNLHTFIVQGPMLWTITFPEEILGLMQLRHLKLPKFYLPNPPSVSADKGSHMGFSNIQTISYMSPCCCTKEFIMRIQNVKELGLSEYQIDSSDGPLNSLVHLQQLETLSLTYRFGGFWPASAKAFPATLKKLKLDKTYLSWSYLDIIAELPNLEVLKLMYRACDGEEWRPTVMGFNQLKLLLIEHNDLKYWKATDDNYPVLERLVLRCCYYLDKIPIEFAEIHSLQLIELNWCLPGLGESAARIQKEQEDIGNNPVDVRISDPSKYIVFIKCVSVFSHEVEVKDVSSVEHALNLHLNNVTCRSSTDPLLFLFSREERFRRIFLAEGLNSWDFISVPLSQITTKLPVSSNVWLPRRCDLFSAELADMIPKSLNGKRYFIADRFHERVGNFIKMQRFINEA